MIFNSATFFIFFVVVYALYLLLRRSPQRQNVLLLVGSYIFYGWWDWRFLSLIALSTLIDYSIGLAMARVDGDTKADKNRRRQLLWCSVLFNLSVLAFFKYFNFFTQSLVDSLGLFGIVIDPITLNVILPVGISFYTFQTMSYAFDIYRGRLEPTRNFINFATFVAFFPQLVAGPIERAANLLPQFERQRHISPEQVETGLFLIIWGLFKKAVIADNIAFIVNSVYNNHEVFYGLDIIIATVAFAIQIYCDFSGYSDIARGVARLLGFELMVNFRLPYFALNPSDFWNRWHISLSTWLRDYLYIPLGGNRHGQFNTYRNLFLTMLLGGLWHGAAANFVLWGAYHGAILIVYRALDRRPIHTDPWQSGVAIWRIVTQMFVMFCLTLIGWLIFRATSTEQIIYMLSNLSLQASPLTLSFFAYGLILTLPLLAMQIMQYRTGDLLILLKFPSILRQLLLLALVVSFFAFGATNQQEFIYFQF